MSKAVLVLNGIDDNFPANDSSLPQEQFRDVAEYLHGCAQGVRNFTTLEQRADAVAASGTITCANVSVSDTVNVAGVTFTAVAATPTAAQFAQGGTDTADGQSLADQVNAHPTASKRVTAVNDAGEVTFTSKVPGDIGNGLALSSSEGTRLAVVAMAGGSDDGLTTYTR